MANILALAVKSQAKHMGRVGFDPRSFPPGTAGPFSHPTCDVPFPPRRPGEYWKGVIPARPLYQGVRGSVWDPEPSRERVGDSVGRSGDGLGPRVCCRKACHKAKREEGCSTRRHMLGPERPEVVSPGRGVVLTDLQSSIDCQYSLSPSLLSLCLSRARSLSLQGDPANVGKA